MVWRAWIKKEGEKRGQWLQSWQCCFSYGIHFFKSVETSNSSPVWKVGHNLEKCWMLRIYDTFTQLLKVLLFLTLKTILTCYYFDTIFFFYDYGLVYFFLLLLNTVLFILGFGSENWIRGFLQAVYMPHPLKMDSLPKHRIFCCRNVYA